MSGLIISLCDYSGVWSAPFLEAGYCVLRVDPKHGDCDHASNGYGAEGDGSLCIMEDNGFGLALTAGQFAGRLAGRGDWPAPTIRAAQERGERIGLLMAPPCTDFSVSGARWFAAKDADGRTAQSVRIVEDCLWVRDLLKPDWWCLENPKGRIAKLVPELGPWQMHFDPADYAGWSDHPEREAYTKDTYLYGDFSTNLRPSPREVVWYYDSKGNRGSWQWKHLGGKSERTKELRSMTPQGFARAFAMAQEPRLAAIYPPHEGNPSPSNGGTP